MRFVAAKVIPLSLVAGSIAVAAPSKVAESSLGTSNRPLAGTVKIAVEEPALAASHHEVKLRIEFDTEGIAALHSIDEHYPIEEIIEPTIVTRVVNKSATPVAAAEARLVADSTALPAGDNA